MTLSRVTLIGVSVVGLLIGSTHQVQGQATSSAPPGTVLASDDFSNPSSGIFPNPQSQSDKWQTRYADGEYQIARSDPTASGTWNVSEPAKYADTTIALDARVAGDAKDQEVGVYCRWQGPPSSGYRFGTFPASGKFFLSRMDAGTASALVPAEREPAVLPDNQTNHLELTCSGSTITATTDGKQVAAVEDGTYRAGQAFLRAGLGGLIDQFTGEISGGYAGNVDARFTRLMLTQP